MPSNPRRRGELLSKLRPLDRHWRWIRTPGARPRRSRSLKWRFGSGRVVFANVEVRRVVDLQPGTPFHGRPVERRGDFERAVVHDRHGGPDRIAVLHPSSKDFGTVDADGELDLTHAIRQV